MSLTGRQLGRYRILEQLGSGGMSVVYKGLDTELEREVAVKVLHSHLAQKPESRARLAREARAVARLAHPNILQIFDFAPDDQGEAYLVTEYIRGRTLRAFADEVGFGPPEVAAMVVHEIASALAQAHEAGIIHRDLKPENVMVREDGAIKLMDFGIARILDRDDRMTQTGALVGSPAHMAPEIIEGQEATSESDVFSLGTILFFFATGKLPFTASNSTATLRKILEGVYEDPRQVSPLVSDGLADIVATSLAKDPSARYPDAGRLRDALGEHLVSLELSRPGDELSSFFADPETYRRALVPRLTGPLLRQGEAMWREGRPAKALSALNQVLAHDPDNARARELLSQMSAARKRQRRRARLFKVAVVAGAGIALCALGAVLAPSLLGSQTPRHAPLALEPVPAPAVVEFKPATSERPSEESEAPQRRAPAAARPQPASGLLPVSITLKPYGHLRVDGAPRTAELTRHALELSPGHHELWVGCAFCEPVKETIEVPEKGAREFFFAVHPRPARLTFDFEPKDAWVTVQGSSPRRVRDTGATPVEVPLGVTQKGLQRKVEYEVFLAGYRRLKREVTVSPGQLSRVPGALEAE